MDDMPSDLTALLGPLRANPEDEARWLALSRWFADNGRDDEAVAVRMFWPSLRDNVTEVGLDETLADLEQNAATMGRLARHVEERDGSS